MNLDVSSKSSRQPVFGPKKWNAETLKTIVCQTATLPPGGGGGFLFIHEIWCFQTKCKIFLGIESIIFNQQYTTYMSVAGLERMTTRSVGSALPYRATQVDRLLQGKYLSFTLPHTDTRPATHLPRPRLYLPW